MLVQFPDGNIVNLDNVGFMSNNDNVLMFFAPGGAKVASYKPAVSSDVGDWLDDIYAASANIILAETSAGTPTISAVSPTSVVGANHVTLTITIADVITQKMIDELDVQVYIDGQLSGFQSATLTQIVVTVPTSAAHTYGLIQIYQATQGALLAHDNTLLTIT